MRILTTVTELRMALDAPRAEGRRIGFVPTMGALHEGHLSLIRRARRDGTAVVVSIFVNPLQFNEQSDLAAYPRDLHKDARLAEGAGAEMLFAPDGVEMYPNGFSTSVTVRGVTALLEGAIRGEAHFTGVTTVVAKLFNIVQPSVAYFGEKDAQQAVVVQRMVRDLDFPIRIEVCETVREADGLAMSSRNVRLDAESRQRATALVKGLTVARDAVANGERNAAVLTRRAVERMSELGVTPEYLEIVSPDDFTTLDTVDRRAIIVVAARVGGVRLIDNMVVEPPGP